MHPLICDCFRICCIKPRRQTPTLRIKDRGFCADDSPTDRIVREGANRLGYLPACRRDKGLTFSQSCCSVSRCWLSKFDGNARNPTSAVLQPGRNPLYEI